MYPEGGDMRRSLEDRGTQTPLKQDNPNPLLLLHMCVEYLRSYYGRPSFLTENILNEIEKDKLEKDFCSLQHYAKAFPQHYINQGFAETEVESLPKPDLPREAIQVPREEEKEKSKESKPIISTQVLGAVSSATVHLCIGAILGYTGVMLPSMTDQGSKDLVLTKHEASIFSSIVNIGAIIGSLMNSVISTWIGQRSTLLVFLPVGMGSWLLLGFAQAYWILILSRFTHGIVIGVTAGCANNYVVELAHLSVRGRLCGLIDLFRQAGFLFVYLIGSTHMTWRNAGLLCGIISMSIPFTSMLFLPHSPRWLATRGRREDAGKALTFYRGSHYDVEPELNDIMDRLNNNGNITVIDQVKELRKRSLFERLIILAVLLFASHFTGDFAMITYSVSIFESANVSINSYLSTILAAVTRVLGSIIYIMMADKYGRRPLFMIPLFLSGVCMMSLGFYFYAKLVLDDVSSVSWLPLTSLVLYTLFTCISQPVLMLLRSELLPTSVRSVGVGLLYFVFFCSTFLVAITYPYMVDSLGSHWTFWIYGITSFAMVLIAAIFIPETQGKSLEEIGKVFNKKNANNQP